MKDTYVETGRPSSVGHNKMQRKNKQEQEWKKVYVHERSDNIFWVLGFADASATPGLSNQVSQ